MNITYKESVTTKQVYTDKTLEEIIDLIRDDPGIKKKVTDIRVSWENQDKEKVDLIKKFLITFYPCIFLPEAGILAGNSFVRSTGIVQFDIDGIAIEQSKELKSKLSKLPFLKYGFISPKGGLKFGVQTDFDCQCKCRFSLSTT